MVLVAFVKKIYKMLGVYVEKERQNITKRVSKEFQKSGENLLKEMLQLKTLTPRYLYLR